jgi:signal peptidase I
MATSRTKLFLLGVWEVFEVVLISLVTVFLIRTFLAQPFLVSGASMEPNFQSGNYLLVDEITYRFREPRRGEVIVFKYPNEKDTFFIKRIIGLPGERVINDDGVITIIATTGEEIELNEEYLPPLTKTPGDFDQTLGEDSYFVLGDNRTYSFDSRNWGALDEEFIVGVARLRVFPVNDLGLVESPEY